MKQKLLLYDQSHPAELNNWIDKGWTISQISSCNVSTAGFYCWVLLEYKY